ncbi:hypothetical protein V6W11_12285 [Micromonospora profundi]|uniref:hypothetical protein n=1 Tax=Micromonospora profundi TaxID=1420889 RepID=UPI002FF0B914
MTRLRDLLHTADAAFAQARADGEAAVTRLARINEPRRMSAGAYALGYGALGLAQFEDDGPDWYTCSTRAWQGVEHANDERGQARREEWSSAPGRGNG